MYFTCKGKIKVPEVYNINFSFNVIFHIFFIIIFLIHLILIRQLSLLSLMAIKSSSILIWLLSLLSFSPRHRNTGLVSSGVSLTSWGEGASLNLVGYPSTDGITIKIPYGVDVLLRRPASQPIFSN